MITFQKHTTVRLSKAVPGETFTHNSRPFTVEALTPYVNAAGRECVVVTLSTVCAVCGERFETTTSRRPKWLPKRCALHRGVNP